MIRIIIFFFILFAIISEFFHFRQDSQSWETSDSSLAMAWAVTALFLLLAFIAGTKGYLLISMLCVPAPLIIWEFIKKNDARRYQKIREQQDEPDYRRLTGILEQSEEPALIYKTLVDLGDLFAKRSDYEKAVEFYEKAINFGREKTVTAIPGLEFNLKRAIKEDRVQKGEIWVCRGCSCDIPADVPECKLCGIRKDAKQQALLDIAGSKKEVSPHSTTSTHL